MIDRLLAQDIIDVLQSFKTPWLLLLDDWSWPVHILETMDDRMMVESLADEQQLRGDDEVDDDPGRREGSFVTTSMID